jgi:hypothetical protein
MEDENEEAEQQERSLDGAATSGSKASRRGLRRFSQSPLLCQDGSQFF